MSEIWKLELREKNPELEKNTDAFDIDFDTAVRINSENEISFHPKFIFYWTEISKVELFGLVQWLKKARVSKKIILPYAKTEQEKFKFGKRALELLGVEHEVTIENVVINMENSKALLSNLGIDYKILDSESCLLENYLDIERYNIDKEVLEIINSVSEFEIRNKAGDFIGARMGRPEKAKQRRLTGSPNVLFPVGREGGRLRSVQAACEAGMVKVDYPVYYCETCKRETIYSVCEECGNKSKKMNYCPECKLTSIGVCKEHKITQHYYNRPVDINHYFEKAKEKLGLTNGEIPILVKGVRGTSSGGHMIENLAKGILRAAHDLQVNKDGTIRVDATELPLISFKPKEIFVSIEKLKELGYDKDIDGKELVHEDQILELMPHDILLPNSSESPDGRAGDVFIKICNFVDDLLVKFYGLKPYYNLKRREDLIGKLGVCIAPHNCAGVVCRIIGFSNTLGLFASPYMHAAIRRDCDGDEAAIMLLGDVLLNFSREFLPSHRGGAQDSPLVLNEKINAGEVDEQILDLELLNEYPLELYRMAEQRKHSSEIRINDVRKALKEGKMPFEKIGFTHDTTNFNEGVACSSYKVLETMQDKLQHQMELVERIRAADTSETARLIIERHFIKDMRGNLRRFSMQGYRCVNCNEIMRRPPLKGSCSRCNGKIIFTTNEGGIKKYLEPALDLAKKYHLSPYIRQSLELTKRHIDSVFGKELETQEDLEKWF
jgi:DNA polymerase II large subunit